MKLESLVKIRNDLIEIPPQIKGRTVRLKKRSNIVGYSWIDEEGYHIRSRWIDSIPESYKQKLIDLLS